MGTSPETYLRSQKILHWLIAALIALQYLAFDSIGRTFGAAMRGAGLTYPADVLGHIIVGDAVLVLMLARIALRLRHGAPSAPPEDPTPLQWLSKAAHAAVYALLLLLPISGLVAWFLQLSSPAEVHEVMTTLLLALIGLHVAAVAVHQFWWKTGLIHRMV